MAEPDAARDAARRHTAQLLKMLRGHGSSAAPAPATVPETAVPSAIVGAVAEAATGYVRRPEPTADRRQKPAATAPADASPPAPFPRAIPTVGELLSRQRGPLGELMSQTEQRVRHNRIFRAYLPPHLRDHAVLVRMDEESWLIHADSSGWATRLRYALHNIRGTLGQHLGMPLPKPHIRVVPAALPPPPRPPLKLTKRSAELLEVTARNLSDERLSAALRRLAAHAGSARNAP
jgi:hypothetical protein